MKFITAAIVLLASAAVVTSLPVYDSTSSSEYDDSYETSTSSDDHYETSTSSDNYYETSTSSDNYYETSTSTSTADYATSTPEPDCEGFKITYPSGSDLSWYDDTQQEVVFDFGTSKIREVEYVDLLKDEDQRVVDQWATGPWNSSNPKTGLHYIHVPEPGYYLFSVYAATQEHHHCTYLSVKFMVTSKGHKGDDYHVDDDDHHGDDYKTTTTPYYDATSTSDDYWPTSTESSSYDDSNFTPYQR